MQTYGGAVFWMIDGLIDWRKCEIGRWLATICHITNQSKQLEQTPCRQLLYETRCVRCSPRVIRKQPWAVCWPTVCSGQPRSRLGYCFFGCYNALPLTDIRINHIGKCVIYSPFLDNVNWVLWNLANGNKHYNYYYEIVYDVQKCIFLKIT